MSLLSTNYAKSQAPEGHCFPRQFGEGNSSRGTRGPPPASCGGNSSVAEAPRRPRKPQTLFGNQGKPPHKQSAFRLAAASFSDAEPGEDFAQNLVGVDPSGDFAHGGEAVAQVGGNKLRAVAHGELAAARLQ